ncbi:MAG TPA: hypothetical protein VFG44_03440 [Burkholderiales bacterium]|nr:hypothetical protein [Burkholderiales bacterium]
MFDEIRCDAPLPDGYDASGVWFKSKSFPDCCLCRYTITKAGRLVDSAGNDLEPEGYLNFYTIDPPFADATESDRQSRWREYRARFVAGQLQAIVVVSENDPDYRYYGLASFRWFNSPSFMFGDPGASDQGGEGDNA